MQQNFVKIPKDLSLIKQKFLFGLTKRQAVCFGIGLAMGLPAFFVTKFLINNLTISVFAMGIFAFPGIACALFQKNGIFFEQYLKLVITFFRKPRVRTYQPLSAFKAIDNQIEYNRLRKKLKTAGVDVSEFKNKKKVKLFDKITNKK